MARQITNRIEFAGTRIEWKNRVTGALELSFDTANIAESIRDRVFMHGAKQILNDALTSGGLERLQSAYRSLTDGTWGTRTPGLPASRVFAACVALGHFADTDDTRAKWRELRDAQRDALRDRPDVRQWLADHNDDSAADAASAALDAMR